ncbi:MAG: bifunctional [glutamate--ammonia ligase]-adenylyl-L-tyrosine phosphorylase/[glutamate--ammonia-ligase] adenylyltransferase [Xanthomonadaceae bacterium]|nr:bifunctional [glutamate--ammonia ligase]-adenylyl-L-tyrosine phosphorylase/[glutamate--ammonia-ligase] adenylyltransferase [Xanthomonadaceae bacterium]
MNLGDHPELLALVESRRAQLAEAAGSDALVRDGALTRLLLASDFAFDELLRWPDPLRWAQWPEPATAAPDLLALPEADWPGTLRRFRRRGSLRLIWRDITGLDTVEETLLGATRLAEDCLSSALSAVDGQMTARHGQMRDGEGQPQSLVVFGLGKLGGGELNFSSDIDLIFAYPEAGESDGARPLAAETGFVRQGQRLIQLLDEVTQEGFCHRVDMRLRPFGDSGRLALSFAAMEDYYQREGRDWERYAWIKARPVAGDIAAGERLLATLRPFVYRRYLDYTALDSLREMKAMIAAEVARRDMADHIKLGPGGIREIEFLVQSLQLIRGGHEPALRKRSLLAALPALVDAGHFSPAVAEAMRAAYLFLRRLENRLQMMADQQTHRLPDDSLSRQRIALALGHADWSVLDAQLQAHRDRVSEEFSRLLAPQPSAVEKASTLDLYWTALPDGDGDGDGSEALAGLGFADPAAADAALRAFASAPATRSMSPRGQERLRRLMPSLLHGLHEIDAPDRCLGRLLELLQAIVKRSSYLALIEERPGLRQRLLSVLSRSALLSDRLSKQPLLLDELIEGGASDTPLSAQSMADELARLLRPAMLDDTEEALRALNVFRHAVSFRIALATLDGAQSPVDSARQLAWLAQTVVRATLDLATHEFSRQHGPAPGAGLAVIGYGSLGGEELGFSSDLDLVFLYDADPAAVSDGARPLEAPRWYARLTQKLVGLLGIRTPSGRLYETDLRLRPDGAGGLLVSSVDSFRAYQAGRAWTWERLALVRARAVAGAGAVCAAFEQTRAEALAQPRDADRVLADVLAMREKMRQSLDRTTADRFDLKHGPGGLVDLEFLVQARLLIAAHTHPALCRPRASDDLIEALRQAGQFDDATAAALATAHASLLRAALACTLDRLPRLIVPDADITAARATVRAACAAAGLDFDRSKAEQSG